jgi:hypothetical protein
MKQRALVEFGGCILDHQRAGRERAEQIGLAERPRRDAARTRLLGPDRREVAFPRTFGPVSASTRSAQSGQRSIVASASAFDVPVRKSSRAKLSACGSASAS